MDRRASLKMLFAAWPREMPPAETQLVYAARLGQIPEEEFERVVLHCIDNYKHLPTVAEIKAEVSGQGAQKFLPAPPKTYDQLDEDRQGRPVIPNAVETLEMLKNVPDPFPTGWKPPPPPTREERLARLRATENWGKRYEQ